MRTLEFTPHEGTDGKVVAYLHDPLTEMPIHREKYPSVVICPGGGYQFCSTREADPVAFEYLSAGYNVFILYYSIKEQARHFTPLKELSSTIMAIRENCEEWDCDSDKIAVCGFSAGGHLAASICTLWNNEYFLKRFDNKGGLNKPNGVILGYPVISALEGVKHNGSINTVSEDEQDEIQILFSLEKSVSKDSCPAFVWHTVEDAGVPVENALLFITAMQKHKVSFEAHIFPTGRHGISVCTSEVGADEAHNRQWVDLSKNWLNKLFDYKL